MADEHGHGHDHAHDHPHDATLARIEALSNEQVHHAGDHEGPFSLHVLGLGATGAAVVTELAKDAPAGFTALAVMRLVEDGVLRLDDPVRAMLGPDLPLVADGVTIEHLLADTSAYESLDVEAVAARGYAFGRLDQLAVEHVMGAR